LITPLQKGTTELLAGRTR